MAGSELVGYLTAWGDAMASGQSAINASDLLPLIDALGDSIFFRSPRIGVNEEGCPRIVFNTPALGVLGSDGAPVPSLPGRPLTILSNRRWSADPSYRSYALEPDRVADIRLAEMGGYLLSILPNQDMGDGQVADVVMMFGTRHPKLRPN